MSLHNALKAIADDDTSQSFYAAICDLNGQLRGKRYGIEELEKIISDGFRMPLSVLGLDMWGEDIYKGEFVFETGDGDGVCCWTGRMPLPLIGDHSPSFLVPFHMTQDGEGFQGDPRYALETIITQYKASGYHPVTAMEMEFYLYDPKNLSPRPPKLLDTGERIDNNAILSLRELEGFEPFLQDLYDLCQRQDIKLDAAIAESGPGQFEVNLAHHDDVMKMADDALYFKEAAKSVARHHGLGASFMAKPYGDAAGNGMHVHFSLLDETGKNLFDNGTDEGSDLLKYAVAGLLSTMSAMTLIYAPHHNSYRRLRPYSHAPNAIAWGYENRTVALRIPGGEGSQKRIEHRVAGADANPYLVMAALLGGALQGMKDKRMPPNPIIGNGYAQDLPILPATWHQAIDEFEKSDQVQQIFNPILQRLLCDCKRQEFSVMLQDISDFEYKTYL